MRRIWFSPLPAVVAFLLTVNSGAAYPATGAGQQVPTDAEEVIGLSFRGRHRAYPLDLLSVKSLINDTVRRQEIVVFHHRQSDTTVAYFRVILGEPIEFSGQVVEGVVADDLTTITRWDMLSGKAVGGNLAGMSLISLPVRRLPWKDWVAAHPETTIYTHSP